jgi:diguanylate cyclase (GGDEF)-like protein
MNYTFSLLMLDIDHFKNCNDRYGHLVGDAVLKEVAKGIKDSVRLIDLVGRYGGEEFLIVLIETDKKQGEIVAERIRKFIEDKSIKVYDEELKVTVSIGISTFPFDSKEVKSLINKADKALYSAKESGRNKIVAFSL